MKSANVCTSIEGEKISIVCRKFSSQPPRRDSGKVVYPFKLSIHGAAKVEKAYDQADQLNRKVSYWSVGDEVHGEAIDGYAGKPIGPLGLVNATHTHKAQGVTLRGGAYAHVEIGVRDHLTSVKQIPDSE